MNETRDPSSADTRASSSGIPLGCDVVAVRASGARRSPQAPTADVPDGADVLAVRDRELRAFCHRLLGCSEDRDSLVDDAVDGLLAATVRGMPIALRGASDLVPVAYALHRRIVGAERPFVVCDPRRRDSEGSVRAPPSRQTGLLALEAAVGGSVCIHSRRLPRDFSAFAATLRESRPTVTLFVCLHGDSRIRDLLCRPLEIPCPTTRASESDRLVQETLDDAAAELGTLPLRIPRQQRQDVLAGVASFAELEKAALRVVALASAPNPSQAAERLGMAPVSLTRWLHRRPWLTAILRHLEARRERGGG